jgi:DNA-directed RNA polymerase subunit beta'
MRANSFSKNISDFDAVRLTVASPERILEWSHGEVTKPETINYRTQKPERDGLFCERIFGPVKDINPNDPKYRGIRTRDMARDERGEIVTKSIVRRERMGHIALAAPVTHIWFLRGVPSATGLLLNMTVKNLERVVYFASYVITKVDTEAVKQKLADLEAETEAAKTAITARYEELGAVSRAAKPAKAEGEAETPPADTKRLAAQRTAELDSLMAEYTAKRTQLDGCQRMRLMSETEYREMPDDYRGLIEVGMGAAALKALLDDIDLKELIKELKAEADDAKGQRRKKIIKRLKVLEGMLSADIRPSSLVITVLPVIPPDLRPMVQLTGGRFATSDLNDLYRRVINRNNRLKKLIDLKAPEVIRRNEMRMLQEAVDALIDNGNARSGRAVAATGGRRRLKSLSDMLKGKQGRFRQNLLGKRVDYSGRSVIVAGPELTIDECGLPKMMALELFKPFVIGRLIDLDLAHNIKSASRMIELGLNEVWDALDEVIKGKYVLINRAPTLHRLGIQAFQPRLIEGKAIQLHPLVCKGFNADFDGDQMAVHLPLSDGAQKEAREMMSARHNLLKPADGSPVLHIEQDIVLGCFYLTYEKHDARGAVKDFGSTAAAIFALERDDIMLQSPIRVPAKGEFRQTTLGRVLFNEIFPEDFTYHDAPMTKKQLKLVMTEVFETYGEDVTARIADDLKDLGFRYATLSGLSTGMDDYSDLRGLDELLEKGEQRAAEVSRQYEQGLITDEERYRLTVQGWRQIDAEVLHALEDQFADEDTSTSVTVISGARGNISQLKQITGSVGTLADATGREIELPIKSNYKDGLSSLEYFTSTRGTRKGMISTALKTADSGYLTRRLVDVSQDVFTTEADANDPGMIITRAESEERGVDFAERIAGRVLAGEVKAGGKVLAKKNELVSKSVAQSISAAGVEEVRIYSVLTAGSVRGIPRKSYGADLATGELVRAHQPIGVIAAQSIGEPGTQLTLDTFHSGGVAGDDISQGLPRIEELFEARTPKGQAYLSEVEGTVSIREEGSDYMVMVASAKAKIEIIALGRATPTVKSGASVSKGDPIAVEGKAKKPIVSPVAGMVEIHGKQVTIAANDGEVVRYRIPGFKSLTVADGDKVEKGGRLTTGSLNLHDLMRLKGIEVTQRYVMAEIQSIFASQGQTIADKHLEVVVRQMFSRVQIEDPGDSPFVIGDIVSRARVVEENENLATAGKEPAEYTQLLLGIAKVATWSDSFLSAASFQDTTRVLISAATSGKVDSLYGLKENVIIGRKIPVGTGVQTQEPPAEIEK